MKKTLLLILAIILAIFLAYKIHSDKNNNIRIYETYNNKKEIVSQTEYLQDSKNSFIICASKDGLLPCSEVNGVKHGAEKWYKNGILEYYDVYNHGVLEKSTLYYENGLKNHEILNVKGRISRENFYSNTPNNDLIESIIYKNTEIIKRFYKNGKIYQEEKYKQNRLVSRKFYNNDGAVERLEEYGGSGEILNPFDNFMDEFEEEDEFESLPDNFDSRGGVWI